MQDFPAPTGFIANPASWMCGPAVKPTSYDGRGCLLVEPVRGDAASRSAVPLLILQTVICAHFFG
jgi:hypothetical protein